MNVKIWEGPVWLEPIEHKYFHRDTNVKYTSVTTVLKDIEPEFDAEGVSASIVRQKDDEKNPIYLGMNQNQILDYWQELNDVANAYGTHVHETLETYLLKNKWWFPNDELQKKIIAGYNTLNIDEGVCIYPERIMFSLDYQLAGTADLIIDINNEFFSVVDYKTNKEFNYYNKYGAETLLNPVNHLQSCQYSIYSLQLSIYAYLYILEFPHKKCRDIYILHWDKEKEEFTKIPIIYLKNEARQILEQHKHNMLYKS